MLMKNLEAYISKVLNVAEISKSVTCFQKSQQHLMKKFRRMNFKVLNAAENLQKVNMFLKLFRSV